MSGITINEAIEDLMKVGRRPNEIAVLLGVSVPMISTWRRKDNDFVPRIGIARKLYKEFGYVIYPYGEYALKE